MLESDEKIQTIFYDLSAMPGPKVKKASKPIPKAVAARIQSQENLYRELLSLWGSDEETQADQGQQPDCMARLVNIVAQGLIDKEERRGIIREKGLAGPCPWCGGHDRFRVWPDEQGRGFWCRVCNQGGDMVKYHMLTTGKKYLEACYDLGVPPRFKPKKFKEPTIEKLLLPPLRPEQDKPIGGGATTGQRSKGGLCP